MVAPAELQLEADDAEVRLLCVRVELQSLFQGLKCPFWLLREELRQLGEDVRLRPGQGVTLILDPFRREALGELSRTQVSGLRQRGDVFRRAGGGFHILKSSFEVP